MFRTSLDKVVGVGWTPAPGVIFESESYVRLVGDAAIVIWKKGKKIVEAPLRDLPLHPSMPVSFLAIEKSSIEDLTVEIPAWCALVWERAPEGSRA